MPTHIHQRQTRRRFPKRLMRHRRRAPRDPNKRKVFNRLVEDNLIRRVSYEEYCQKIRKVYGGPQGALLKTCSLLSGHVALGERFLKERKFDLAGARNILDVGSGAGQIAGHLLKYADAEASVTCLDISPEMLRRARAQLKSLRPRFIAADLTRLPFPDQAFDCVTCGYVLEHLPEARPGLAELARVMIPGGRMLLFTTEDSFSGAWTSRLWACRTYNRRELLACCEEVGLVLRQELWFTPLHKALRAGGICVELVRNNG